MNVLVIDDHEMIGDLFSALIRRDFLLAQVHVATTLKEGMKIVQDNAAKLFSIAVLNLTIKGESEGSDTIRTFRTAFPLIPVLAVSVLDSKDVAASVYKEGAREFLPKF